MGSDDDPETVVDSKNMPIASAHLERRKRNGIGSSRRLPQVNEEGPSHLAASVERHDLLTLLTETLDA